MYLYSPFSICWHITCDSVCADIYGIIDTRREVINATVNTNKDITPDLTAAHVLSGCDTVACCHGIGKSTALKVIKSRKYTPTLIGDQVSTLDATVN